MKKEAYETYGMVKSGMHKGKKMKKEAEELLGVDDNQDAEGKKATPAPKGGKKQPEPKMKPSSASAKTETMHKMKEHADALLVVRIFLKNSRTKQSLSLRQRFTKELLRLSLIS